MDPDPRGEEGKGKVQFFMICNTMAPAKIVFETLLKHTFKHLLVIPRWAFLFQGANTVVKRLNKARQR